LEEHQAARFMDTFYNCITRPASLHP